MVEEVSKGEDEGERTKKKEKKKEKKYGEGV